MVFKCQTDSFLKEFSANVVSCKDSQFQTITHGEEKVVNGFEVVLEDTILFPEGGGQPSDHGFLNDSRVFYVKRIGSTAVHFVDKSLTIGEKVIQTVNWDRRFDHMQQHSGQHLITAIIDREFGFATVSWYLGEHVSYIELDTPKFDPKNINHAEFIINELIRDCKKVTVDVYQCIDDLKGIRARGLPNDHEGDVRVITIDGIESNMCCGTHVSNLSQLQVVKLLHAEKSKRKDKTLLYFIVGNRVLKRLSTCLEREQQLTVLLKNNPIEHSGLVQKLQQNIKVITKDLKTTLKDLAVYEAATFKKLKPEPKYYILHRKEGDSDFISIFLKETTPTNTFLCLTVGDPKGSGNIVLYGEDNIISIFSKKILELMDGKGAGKGNKFQAKVNNMKNFVKVESLIKEYFK